MAPEPDYATDVEFTRLIRREPSIDVQRAALELARDEYPEIEIPRYLAWFDEVADALRPRLWRADGEREILELLVGELCRERGLYGTSESFRDPRCSYLNRVIETGRGLPITLSLVYMGIARRLGVELHGVASPMHFVCRIESHAGPLFLDAFTKGRILTEDECLEWLARVSQFDEDLIQRSLGPTDSRSIVLRMLTNLKALYAQLEKWTSLWKVQHRLCALLPGNWQERRDLGMVSVQAQRPGLAVKLLSECLKSCPEEDDRAAIEHALEQANTLLAGLN